MKSLEKTAKDVTRKPRGFKEKIWKNGGEKLEQHARRALLDLARTFWNEIEHGDARLEDVTFSGSLTGDRWTDDSDVDLHIVVKRGKDLDDETMAREYYRARSRIWNGKHDLELEGHPVELYIQDSSQPHYSARIYSVLRDGWVKKEKQGEYPSTAEVTKKAKPIASNINSLVKELKKNPSKDLVQKADKMSERLRKLRQEGLEGSGESSVENLAYKALKRAGYMEKLNDARDKAFDELYQGILDRT